MEGNLQYIMVRKNKVVSTDDLFIDSVTKVKNTDLSKLVSGQSWGGIRHSGNSFPAEAPAGSPRKEKNFPDVEYRIPKEGDFLYEDFIGGG